jgi:hypothetical protein
VRPGTGNTDGTGDDDPVALEGFGAGVVDDVTVLCGVELELFDSGLADGKRETDGFADGEEEVLVDGLDDGTTEAVELTIGTGVLVGEEALTLGRERLPAVTGGGVTEPIPEVGVGRTDDGAVVLPGKTDGDVEEFPGRTDGDVVEFPGPTDGGVEFLGVITGLTTTTGGGLDADAVGTETVGLGVDLAGLGKELAIGDGLGKVEATGDAVTDGNGAVDTGKVLNGLDGGDGVIRGDGRTTELGVGSTDGKGDGLNVAEDTGDGTDGGDGDNCAGGERDITCVGEGNGVPVEEVEGRADCNTEGAAEVTIEDADAVGEDEESEGEGDGGRRTGELEGAGTGDVENVGASDGVATTGDAETTGAVFVGGVGKPETDDGEAETAGSGVVVTV